MGRRRWNGVWEGSHKDPSNHPSTKKGKNSEAVRKTTVMRRGFWGKTGNRKGKREVGRKSMRGEEKKGGELPPETF